MITTASRCLRPHPRLSSIFIRYQHVCASRTIPTYGHALLMNKALISVKGPDATKFLNGLVTYKMLPTYVKKKEMTISNSEQDISTLLKDFDIQSSNWGNLKESLATGNLTVTRNGVFTALLNSKGRVISDVFLYPRGYTDSQMDDVPEYLVEIDSSLAKTLMGILRIHKLKTKVDIKLLDDFKVWYAFNDLKQDTLYAVQNKYFDEESLDLKDPDAALQAAKEFLHDPVLFQPDLDQSKIVGFAFDDRCPDFGIKLITRSEVEDIHEVLNDQFLPQTSRVELETLDLRRYLTGIAEVPSELTPNRNLPLESCFEYMGGINFDKGCYIGQELTVRTYHTGILRKRVVPVKLYPYEIDPNKVELDLNDEVELGILHDIEIFSDAATDPEPKKQLAASPFGNSSTSSRRSKRATSSGTLLRANRSVGLALVRLEDFASDGRFHLDVPISDTETRKIGVKAFIPYWWPSE